MASSRYVFVAKPGASVHASRGGTLMDEQTGRRTSVSPPVPSGYECQGEGVAIGGPWLAFECWVSSPTGVPVAFRLELYRIATGQWRSVQDPFTQAPVQGIGADWIEYWVPVANATYPKFVFQNIYTGQTQSLAAWQPGGRIVPNLNLSSLAQPLCAPLRVPNAWEGTEEDWPGTISFFGRAAVVGGTSQDERAFGYLERCGTHMHRGSAPSDRRRTGFPEPMPTPWCGKRPRLSCRAPTCRA